MFYLSSLYSSSSIFTIENSYKLTLRYLMWGACIARCICVYVAFYSVLGRRHLRGLYVNVRRHALVACVRLVGYVSNRGIMHQYITHAIRPEEQDCSKNQKRPQNSEHNNWTRCKRAETSDRIFSITTKPTSLLMATQASWEWTGTQASSL